MTDRAVYLLATAALVFAIAALVLNRRFEQREWEREEVEDDA